MAGWRARPGGDDVDGEPIELVADDDPSEVEVGGGRGLDWHALIRTGAAVVAAVSLLWMGRSWADERADAQRSECSNDLQNAMWRWEEAVNVRGSYSPRGSSFPDDVVDDFVARARECGDDLIARAVVHRFEDDD